MQIKLSGSQASALFALASQLIIGMTLVTHAQDQASPPSSSSPDNSSNNKIHDKTAQSQKENASDREMTQKIRQSFMADKSLSTYAHDVKIITQDGKVTLKGHDQNENETIASQGCRRCWNR